jgi:HAMP domain-containing protein
MSHFWAAVLAYSLGAILLIVTVLFAWFRLDQPFP